jgi:predicted membrane-bound spermidine synthase
LSLVVAGGWALKNTFVYPIQVVSVQTQFQRIDIYDVVKHNKQKLESYEEFLLSQLGPHESYDQPLFRPDRRILLDGWIQSTLYNEASYHEALVHPAMFSHANPKRVAIVGGGEGATLREVLKHNTVQEAIMIEIDEMMVNVSRSFIPEWSDCRDLVGSTPWCVDDPRARVYYEDALGWFMDRYYDGDKSGKPMDVVIIDAL